MDQDRLEAGFTDTVDSTTDYNGPSSLSKNIGLLVSFRWSFIFYLHGGSGHVLPLSHVPRCRSKASQRTGISSW